MKAAPLPPPDAERRTSSLLAQTLSASYVPGTNLRRRFPRAGWIYLLPELELGDVLCLGVPSKETLVTLARHARSLTVACLTPQDLQARDRMGRNEGQERLRLQWLDGRTVTAWGSKDGWSLVVVATRGARRWLSGEARVDALRSLLGPGTTAYLEWRRLGSAPLRDREVLPWLNLGTPRVYRLLPSRGEAQLAVPQADAQTLDLLRKRGLGTPRPWLSVRGPLAKIVRRLPALPELGHRYGVVVNGPASAERAGRPPAYLCALASRSGFALEDHRWGLSIPRGYQSRKVAFFLFGPRAGSSCVAKMVPDSSMNVRVANEARALRDLESLGMAEDGRVPRVLFYGEHAGRAILGQTMIEGVSFQARTRGGPGCPLATEVLETFLRLGRLDRPPRHAAGEHVAGALEPLLDRFAEIYGDRELVSFLREHVASLRNHPGPIPVVFQHGDPGAWNMLVTPRGQVAMLDWEAAESEGMPLWDLFYFLRSYGVLSARRPGGGGSAHRAFERTFLGEDPLARWARAAVTRYSAAVGVAPPLVEPLFCLCWMHRSVKEATRLEPRDLSQGHYLGLLKTCLREREAVRRLAVSAD